MDNFIMSILRSISLAAVLLVFRTALIVSSQNSALYFVYKRPAYPRDCKEAVDSCHYQRLSGVYAIKPDGYHKPFEVYCDTTVDSGGWTVILRRHDGSVTFQRNWLEYKLGFGFLSQELWIGTEKLSYLTNQDVYELRIDFTYSDGRSTYLICKFFRITDDFSNYKLTSLGLYEGADGCPTNMEYGTCICQSSCGCLQDCLPCSQEEGCFCPSGFFLKGAECVPREECGCTVDGNTIGEGVWYVATGCTRRYICISGILICDNNYRCGDNAVCEQRNSVLGCYCNPGYLGNGVICNTTCPANTEYGVCTCQTHCRDPYNCLPCEQSETCYCTNGYFLELNGTCVRPEHCGCYDDDDGIIIPEGQIYTPPGCSKRCTCINGQRHCNYDYQCSSNAVCETRNGVLQCYCNPGYVGDGVTCESICQQNRVFGTCPCETTCANPHSCGSCTQGQPCYCPSRFYLQGSSCVPPEKCGCFTEGRIIPEGQTYTSSDCSKMCNCTNGQLQCNENYQCSPNAVCGTRNNVFQCHCNPGYVGDGVTCVTTCPANTEYGVCICQTHCRDPYKCLPCGQRETCYCTNGYFLELNGTCVRPEHCGCYDDDDGIIIPEGQIYTPPDCSKRCTCINGQRHCNYDYQCSSNAVCETRNDVLKCYCNPGYVGDGETCVSMCQDDRVFGTCTCETTCANPHSCRRCTQGQLCHCPSGSYLQGSNCVQPGECRCFTDGRIIPEGQTYTSPDCSKMCNCTNGQLDCNNNYQCSPNAVCETRNNVRQCYCNPEFAGDGVTCEPVCQPNRVLGTCPCETTCENPDNCGSCTHNQACYCPSGFFIQGQHCVQREDCGCYIDGIIVPERGTHVNSDCTQHYTCINNQLDPDPTYQCSPNAACIIDNGIRRCVCNDGYAGDGLTCAAFTDCYDAYGAGQTVDGIYTILPTGWPGLPFEVFCNMTFGDGGWTVFQRRTDGVTDFYRNWEEYKQGFGTLNQGNDFWLGNEQLHYLTDQRDYILRIDFVHSSDQPYFEEFTTFKIGDESDKYRLSYDSVNDANTGWNYGYSDLNYNNGKQFSTRDQDNDGCNNHHYADRHKGGWWYSDYSYWCNNCYASYCYNFQYGSSGCYTFGTYTNLNGDYNGGSGENIFYNVFGSNDCNHKFAEMKIRPSI